MAEAPLPRYRSPGILLADMPRLDFVNLRESYRSSAALTENLNALSTWAFGKAEKQAKDEGMQYGAENPVTLEQLRDGTGNVGKKGTIFGEAARKQQVEGIVTDLQLDAHSRINALKLRVDAGEVDTVAAVADMKDMIDGYSSAVSRIDPHASRQLRANIGTAANSALLEMQKAAITREKENRKIAVDNWIDVDVPELVRSAIAAGDTVDPTTGKIVTAQQRIDAIKPTLIGQLNGIGDDAFARQARTKFEKLVADHRISALAKVASDPAFARRPDGTFDPIGAVQRLDKGDFGAYTGMYNALPADEQAKVRTALRQAAADRFTAETHVRQEGKQRDELEVNRLVVEFPTASPVRRREIEGRLNAIATSTGAITGTAINALKKSLKEGDGTGKANEVGETRLRLDILNGRIRTPEQLWDQGLKYGVNPKQVNEVLGFFVSRQNRAETEADRRLRTAAGLAPGVINPSAHRADAYINLTRQLNDQVRLQAEAHRSDPAKNPAPDLEAIAETLVRKRQESPLMKGIENDLKTLNDQYGPNGTTKKTGITFGEDSDPADVEKALRAAGVGKAQAADALTRLKAIEQRRRQLNQLRH